MQEYEVLAERPLRVNGPTSPQSTTPNIDDFELTINHNENHVILRLLKSRSRYTFNLAKLLPKDNRFKKIIIEGGDNFITLSQGSINSSIIAIHCSMLEIKQDVCIAAASMTLDVLMFNNHSKSFSVGNLFIHNTKSKRQTRWKNHGRMHLQKLYLTNVAFENFGLIDTDQFNMRQYDAAESNAPNCTNHIQGVINSKSFVGVFKHFIARGKCILEKCDIKCKSINIFGSFSTMLGEISSKKDIVFHAESQLEFLYTFFCSSAESNVNFSGNVKSSDGDFSCAAQNIFVNASARFEHMNIIRFLATNTIRSYSDSVIRHITDFSAKSKGVFLDGLIQSDDGIQIFSDNHGIYGEHSRLESVAIDLMGENLYLCGIISGNVRFPESVIQLFLTEKSLIRNANTVHIQSVIVEPLGVIQAKFLNIESQHSITTSTSSNFSVDELSFKSIYSELSGKYQAKKIQVIATLEVSTQNTLEIAASEPPIITAPNLHLQGEISGNNHSLVLQAEFTVNSAKICDFNNVQFTSTQTLINTKPSLIQSQTTNLESREAIQDGKIDSATVSCITENDLYVGKNAEMDSCKVNLVTHNSAFIAGKVETKEELNIHSKRSLRFDETSNLTTPSFQLISQTTAGIINANTKMTKFRSDQSIRLIGGSLISKDDTFIDSPKISINTNIQSNKLQFTGGKNHRAYSELYLHPDGEIQSSSLKSFNDRAWIGSKNIHSTEVGFRNQDELILSHHSHFHNPEKFNIQTRSCKFEGEIIGNASTQFTISAFEVDFKRNSNISVDDVKCRSDTILFGGRFHFQNLEAVTKSIFFQGNSTTIGEKKITIYGDTPTSTISFYESSYLRSLQCIIANFDTIKVAGILQPKELTLYVKHIRSEPTALIGTDGSKIMVQCETFIHKGHLRAETAYLKCNRYFLQLGWRAPSRIVAKELSVQSSIYVNIFGRNETHQASYLSFISFRAGIEMGNFISNNSLISIQASPHLPHFGFLFKQLKEIKNVGKSNFKLSSLQPITPIVIGIIKKVNPLVGIGLSVALNTYYLGSAFKNLVNSKKPEQIVDILPILLSFKNLLLAGTNLYLSGMDLAKEAKVTLPNLCYDVEKFFTMDFVDWCKDMNSTFKEIYDEYQDFVKSIPPIKTLQDLKTLFDAMLYKGLTNWLKFIAQEFAKDPKILDLIEKIDIYMLWYTEKKLTPGFIYDQRLIKQINNGKIDNAYELIVQFLYTDLIGIDGWKDELIIYALKHCKIAQLMEQVNTYKDQHKSNNILENNNSNNKDPEESKSVVETAETIFQQWILPALPLLLPQSTDDSLLSIRAFKPTLTGIDINRGLLFSADMASPTMALITNQQSLVMLYSQSPKFSYISSYSAKDVYLALDSTTRNLSISAERFHLADGIQLNPQNIDLEVDELQPWNIHAANYHLKYKTVKNEEDLFRLENDWAFYRTDKLQSICYETSHSITITQSFEAKWSYSYKATEITINAGIKLISGGTIGLISTEGSIINNGSLIGKMIIEDSAVSIFQEAGSMQAKKIYMHALYRIQLDRENIIADVAMLVTEREDIINIASTVRAKRFLLVDAKRGDVVEICKQTATTTNGEEDFIYYKASFYGGNGDGFNGCGLYVHAGNLVVNDASEFVSDGKFYINGDMGVLETERHNTYCSNVRHHKRWGGAVRKVEKDYAVRMQCPTMKSTSGAGGVIESTHGRLDVTCGKFESAGAIQIYSHEQPVFREVIVVTQHISRTKLFSAKIASRQEKMTEFVSSSFIAPKAVIIIVRHGDIVLPDITIDTPYLLTRTWRGKTVFIGHPVTHDIDETYWGFSCHLGPLNFSTSLSPDEPNRIGFDISPFDRAENFSDGLNIANASTGIAYKLLCGNGMDLVKSSTVGVSFTYTQKKSHYEEPSRHYIRVGVWDDYSSEVLISGLSGAAAQWNLHRAKRLTFNGQELNNHCSMVTESVSVEYNPFTNSASAAAGVSTYTAKGHAFVTNSFSVNEINFGRKAEVELTNAKINAKSASGEIPSIRVHSDYNDYQEHSFSESFSTNGSVSVNTHRVEGHDIPDPAGFHLDENYHFQVHQVSLDRGRLSGNGFNGLEYESFNQTPIESYKKESGFGIAVDLERQHPTSVTYANKLVTHTEYMEKTQQGLLLVQKDERHGPNFSIQVPYNIIEVAQDTFFTTNNAESVNNHLQPQEEMTDSPTLPAQIEEPAQSTQLEETPPNLDYNQHRFFSRNNIDTGTSNNNQVFEQEHIESASTQEVAPDSEPITFNPNPELLTLPQINFEDSSDLNVRFNYPVGEYLLGGWNGVKNVVVGLWDTASDVSLVWYDSALQTMVVFLPGLVPDDTYTASSARVQQRYTAISNFTQSAIQFLGDVTVISTTPLLLANGCEVNWEACSQALENTNATLLDLYEPVANYANWMIYQSTGPQLAEQLASLMAPGLIGKTMTKFGLFRTSIPVAVEVPDPIPVFHATSSVEQYQSVLNGIDLKYCADDSRVGPGFYVAEFQDTTIAELQNQGRNATHIIRYDFDIASAKILDLTNPEIAERWGYQIGPRNEISRLIGENAEIKGYNVIKFPSERGAGANFMIKSDFDKLLQPKFDLPIMFNK